MGSSTPAGSLGLTVTGEARARLLNAYPTLKAFPDVFPLLDHIVSVEDVQIFKPSPRGYALALERLSVSPAALGFVSSNSWDTAGAASAGLRTFWTRANNQACQRSRP